MNSNVSIKEKGKLLAAFAVLAMVVCAFAIAIPAEETDAIGLDDSTDSVHVYDSEGTLLADLTFKEALYVLSYDENQTYFTDVTLDEGITVDLLTGEGQTFVFDAGQYDVVGPSTISNWTVSKFVINADNVTITSAEGADVVFYGSALNGANQSPALDLNQGDTIAVMGDGITISNVTVMPTFENGEYTNKAIEIFGSNVSVVGVTVTANTLTTGLTSTYGGSIYVNNASDVEQDVTINDVTVENGMITFTGATENTSVTINNTEVTVTDSNGIGINNALNPGMLDITDVTITVSGSTSYGEGYNVYIPGGVTMVITETGSISVEGGSFSVDAEADFQNDGTFISGTEATVADFDGLVAALNSSTVTTITLNGDVTLERNTNIGTKTVNLNGHNLTVGTYNLNAYNGKIIVPSGSTFSFDGIVKISETGLQTEAGATIYYGTSDAAFYKTGDSSSDPSVIGSHAFTPDFEELTQVSIINTNGIRNTYTIFHTTTVQGVDLQFGISTNNVTYDGQQVEERDFTILPYIFETGWTLGSFVPTVDTTNMIDAGTYTDAIRVSLSINQGTDYAVPIVYLDAVVLQREPGTSLIVPNDGWNYNGTIPDFQTDVEGINGETVDGVWTYEYFQNYDDLQNRVSMGSDAEALLPGQYTVIGTFTPTAYPDGNYDTATARDDFTVSPATLNVDFEEVPANAGFWGTSPDRYMDLDGYDVVVSVDEDENNIITISGGVYYIADFNSEANTTVYGESMNSGYYAFMRISNPNDFEIKVTITNSEGDRVYYYAPGEARNMIYWLGNDLQSTDISRPITVTPNVADTGFGSVDYTLNFDLERITTSGYSADASDADKQIKNQGFDRTGNVAAETMWIAYDGAEYATVVTYGYLFYDGKLVNYEVLPQGAHNANYANDSGRLWYFSFADGQGVATWLSSHPVEGYTIGAEGEYTMYISTQSYEEYVANGNVLASYFKDATVYIGGSLDSGFKYFGDDAREGIIDGNPSFTNTDVQDQTLWFNWYQDVEYNSLTITLTKNDSEVSPYTETTGFMGVGYHTFYASFLNQLSQFAADPIGTYQVEVRAGETLVASGTITVSAEDSYVEIKGPQAPEGGDLLGMEESQLQVIDGITISRPDMGSDVQITVDGQLVYIPAGGYSGFQENSQAGYYLALNANSRGWNWADYQDIVVTLGDKTFTIANVQTGEWDGTFIVYLGSDIKNLRTFTLTVDFDGKGPFFEKYTYTIDATDMTAFEYTVLLVDKYNDTIQYMMGGGEVLTLPNGSEPAAGFLYWVDENGKNRNAGSSVIITPALDADADGTIEFQAVYESNVPSHSITYYINHAVDYVYDGWDYTGTFVTYGNKVISVYNLEDIESLDDVMNDFARYMGALYRTADGDVTQVTFNGVDYTWKAGINTKTGAEVWLSGSNWRDADGNTLVSAVVDYVEANISGMLDLSINIEVSNSQERQVLNYGVNVNMPVPDEDPTVTIDMPTSFVTGQEYVFTVSTTPGDYGGVMVLGTALFSAPEGSYTVWYMEGNPQHPDYGKWILLQGDSFGPEGGFPLTDATSYFKVVFNEAGNYDLNVEIVDTEGNVLCDDSAKVVVLDASDLPEYDTREPRQQGDYGVDYAVVFNEETQQYELHVYIVTDKVDTTVYRNALTETKITVMGTGAITTEYELYLSENLGLTDDGKLIVADYVLDIPDGTILIRASGWYADHWFYIGNMIPISGLVVTDITLNPTEINMTVGQETDIEATVNPDTAIDKTIQWTSSNPELVSVDANGHITAFGYTDESVIITATIGDVSATCSVNVKEMTSIEVVPPTKTQYYAGESLDTTGMEVYANYTDGSREQVEDYQIDTTVLSTPGTAVTVTVSYMGFEDSFDVTVGAVSGISIQLPETIVAGTTLTAEDLNIMISYTNGLPSRAPVGEVTFDPVTVQLGDTTLTVSYTEAGFSTENIFPIVVVEQTETTE